MWLRAEGGQWFEIDLAVVTPYAVYLIDVKSTYGEIHVAGGKWHPESRAPYASPLAKLRQHCRQLHGVFSAAVTPANQGMRHVWVDALIILTNPSAILRDLEGRDRDSVVKLDQAVRASMDPSRLPVRTPPPAPTAPFLGKILETFSGKNARPLQALPLLGLSWQCEERLTSNDFYTEYRARNTTGFSTERVILRGYRADPYATQAEREAERQRIANAYSALTTSASSLHPGSEGLLSHGTWRRLCVGPERCPRNLPAGPHHQSRPAVDHGSEDSGNRRSARCPGPLPRARCHPSGGVAIDGDPRQGWKGAFGGF